MLHLDVLYYSPRARAFPWEIQLYKEKTSGIKQILC